MPIINPRIRFIENFLANFNSVFLTKHQRSIFREFIYAMFSDYKRMSLAAIANNTTVNYQKLQYFFSESGWSIQGLNDIRIKILQNQRTTRADNKGILAVDDTVCTKPHAEKTEGAQVQYRGPLGREENCNVAVASCFVSNTKHSPILNHICLLPHLILVSRGSFSFAWTGPRPPSASGIIERNLILLNILAFLPTLS